MVNGVNWQYIYFWSVVNPHEILLVTENISIFLSLKYGMNNINYNTFTANKQPQFQPVNSEYRSAVKTKSTG